MGGDKKQQEGDANKSQFCLSSTHYVRGNLSKNIITHYQLGEMSKTPQKINAVSSYETSSSKLCKSKGALLKKFVYKSK